MEYGINVFGLPIAIQNERLIQEVASFRFKNTDFINDWYDIPNIPQGTKLEHILVFARRSYAKAWDGEKYRLGIREKGIKYLLLPKLRIHDGKYQICLNFDRRNVKWAHDPLEDKLGSRVYPIGIDFTPINSLDIDLKIAIRLDSVPQQKIPKYGIAVYSQDGTCIYSSNINGVIKEYRTITYNESDLDIPEYNLDKLVKYSKEIGILNENEYVLLGNLGHYDSCSPAPGGRGEYLVGLIELSVDQNGRIHSGLVAHFAEMPQKKHSFPSRSNEYFSNVKITNRNILIATFE